MNYASLGATVFALLLFDEIYTVLSHHSKWISSLQIKLKPAAFLKTLQSWRELTLQHVELKDIIIIVNMLDWTR